jgi:hypothetical protein
MLRRLGSVLMCFAMFSIVGGHWAALQTVAWVGMVAEYSQTSSLGMAIRKTLSGEDPCSMCHAIEKGKAAESKLPAVVQAGKKLDGIFHREATAAPRPHETTFSYPPVADDMASLLPSAPPAPVPIAA